MLNIIICGAPGSGKGTQSDLIVSTYNLKHFSTGDLLRAEIQSQTELGLIANSYISKGNLVPDQMIIDILMNAIKLQKGQSKGIILDGFPRTLAQAEALESIFESKGMKITLLLDLEVDDEELIARLLKRGETSGRSDDNLETIRKRLEVYKNQTTPVSDFYKKLNKYAEIKGTGSVDDIFGRICAVLNQSK